MIQIAHSPDADDAFMFAALSSGLVDTEGLQFTEVREDIETLNRRALEGTYEVSAVSMNGFAHISDKYKLLSTGMCFGDRYGPVVVASKALRGKQLLKVRIGVPGKKTTAFMVLRLYEQNMAGDGKSGVCYTEVNFDQIIDQVVEGKLDAGLIIHEGQLSYESKGLHKIVDLGEWWWKEYKQPLPLGGIVVRRDLDNETQVKIGRVIQRSIQYGLEHKEEILQKALPYARGLDPEKALQFIQMYVNERTIACGRDGLKSIKILFDKAHKAGLIKNEIDWADSFINLRGGNRETVEDASPIVEESVSAAEPTA